VPAPSDGADKVPDAGMNERLASTNPDYWRFALEDALHLFTRDGRGGPRMKNFRSFDALEEGAPR